MARIQFKGKVENMGEVGSDAVLYQYINVPVFDRKHCDMAAFRCHAKYGAYANSDMFKGMLARIRSESYVWRDCSQALPNSERLLAMADEGYCIDRPTRIPAGSTGRDDSLLIDIFHQ